MQLYAARVVLELSGWSDGLAGGRVLMSGTRGLRHRCLRRPRLPPSPPRLGLPHARRYHFLHATPSTPAPPLFSSARRRPAAATRRRRLGCLQYCTPQPALSTHPGLVNLHSLCSAPRVSSLLVVRSFCLSRYLYTYLKLQESI